MVIAGGEFSDNGLDQLLIEGEAIAAMKRLLQQSKDLGMQEGAVRLLVRLCSTPESRSEASTLSPDTQCTLHGIWDFDVFHSNPAAIELQCWQMLEWITRQGWRNPQADRVKRKMYVWHLLIAWSTMMTWEAIF